MQEIESDPNSVGEPRYAKEQLRTTNRGDCSLLGLKWQKEHYTVSIAVPTKCGVLAKFSKVFNPLGVVASVGG